MRIGILGTGLMGKMHGNLLKTFPEVTLKGIVEDYIGGKADPELPGIETTLNSLKLAVLARQLFTGKGNRIEIL